MKRSNLKRVLASILCALMIVTFLPATSFAGFTRTDADNDTLSLLEGITVEAADDAYAEDEYVETYDAVSNDETYEETDYVGEDSADANASEYGDNEDNTSEVTTEDVSYEETTANEQIETSENGSGGYQVTKTPPKR